MQMHQIALFTYSFSPHPKAHVRYNLAVVLTPSLVQYDL